MVQGGTILFLKKVVMERDMASFICSRAFPLYQLSFALLLCSLVNPIEAQSSQRETGNILLRCIPAITSGSKAPRSESTPPEINPGDGTHASISKWQGTATCLACHQTEAEDLFHSTHYQWLGDTPYMTNGPDLQGKLDLGVNSYCINTTGNWNGCGACHVGLGDRPQATVSRAQLENIDCLICHQDQYKRKKLNGRFVADTAAMTIDMVNAARTVHLPTRTGCLQCHAKGGGGDNYKRGDMALAHGTTADKAFDVHMATSGADLSCQSCHITEKHRMAGKGSDLRPTDLDREMSCTTCHTDKGSALGHENRAVNRHVARVACQSCHIPRYARNASDTQASEETEIHRDWQQPHPIASGAIHPQPTMAGNLLPSYRWWNGLSTSYLLFDQAVTDPDTGNIPTSRPLGSVDDNRAKLYPFKYKTALQPLATVPNQLIALDTSVYFSTGDHAAATAAGLVNMGYSSASQVAWVTTDTYQLITHEVAPQTSALGCADCHDSNSRMNLVEELGYELKGPKNQVCTQCHGSEDDKDDPAYLWVHAEHVTSENIDCSLCHTFSRPERGLSTALVDND